MWTVDPYLDPDPEICPNLDPDPGLFTYIVTVYSLKNIFFNDYYKNNGSRDFFPYFYSVGLDPKSC